MPQIWVVRVSPCERWDSAPSLFPLDPTSFSCQSVSYFSEITTFHPPKRQSRPMPLPHNPAVAAAQKPMGNKINPQAEQLKAATAATGEKFEQLMKDIQVGKSPPPYQPRLPRPSPTSFSDSAPPAPPPSPRPSLDPDQRLLGPLDVLDHFQMYNRFFIYSIYINVFFHPRRSSGR